MLDEKEIERYYKRVILNERDGGLGEEKLKEIFGAGAYTVVLAYSSGEIVEMIKAYEEKQARV